MVEPVEAAVDASFPDDFLLLDFPSVHDPNPNHNPHQKEEAEQKETLKNPNLTSAAAGGKQQNPSLLFQDILDTTVDSLPGLTVAGAGGGGEEEEEELEWLSNKEAFPPLETSFEIPTRSRSSSSSGGSSATAAAAERVSPVSVLAAPAPVWVKGARSKGGRKRRRILLGISSEQPRAAEGKGGEKRKCWHCQAEETPQWRAGPDGPKTLCNACGVRYKSGRLVPEYRPANSPTFSATLHSNSHRRILEMRRRRTVRGRKSTRTSPPPLLADHSAL